MKKALLIHPEELNDRWIDCAASLGIDVIAIHPWGGLRAYQTLEDLLCLLETDDYRNKIDRIFEKGMQIEYEFHAAGWLLPRDLFKTNPEYFRVNHLGERTNDINLCVSNKEAVDIVARASAQLIKRLYRSSHRYFFWLDDVEIPSCHCEKCKGISDSDQQMIVLNAMISEMRKVDPQATLAYLAYRGTLTPPTIKPADGIFLEYAPISRDFTKPVSEGSGEDIENITELLKIFGTKDAVTLEYWYDNSLFSGWKKPPKKFCPNNDIIKQDVKFYNTLGFSEMRSFACFLGEDYVELYGEPDLSAFK